MPAFRAPPTEHGRGEQARAQRHARNDMFCRCHSERARNLVARKARRRVAGFLAAARNDNKVSIKALRRLPRAERAPRGTASLPCFAPTEHCEHLVQSAPRIATCFFAVIPSVSEKSVAREARRRAAGSLAAARDDNKVSNRSVTPFAARGEGGQEDSLAAVFRAPTEHCEYPRTKRAARSDMFFRCNSERERGIWRRGVRAAAPPDPSLPLGMTASCQSKR